MYGSTGSMMSILVGKANSFIEEITFSADCEDCHFCSEKIVSVKRIRLPPSLLQRIYRCNVVTPNGDRRLWWTRHSHVHLAAADKTWRRGRPRNPFFDPRGIEPRRPEDEGEML
ncbi:hypothetical protein TNCV_509771 [Trichonephila clavipes]|nr:hypothetical protein TNCV_509771 [Trichonephila clavipes]